MPHITLNLKSVTALSVPLLLLTACGSTPASLSETSSATANLDKSAMSVLHVASVIDDREEGAVLTDLLGREMEGVDLMSWLETSLEKRGVSLAETAPSDDMCSVDLSLKRAIVTAKKGTSKQSNLVFSVKPAGDSDAERKIIRGTDASMNWANTSGETNRALGKALDNALNKLSEHCDTI